MPTDPSEPQPAAGPGKLPPATDPKKFPIFGTMDKATYIARKTNLLQPLYFFATEELSINWSDIKFNQNSINNIVDMVQRREVYFHVFHDIEMGELNEACLNCFWIMKFCPFHYVREPNHNINITFALALFTRAITYVTKKENNRPPNYTESAIKHLVHAFAYRDLSKEALMAIGKSLAG